jgi:hypothetical protein
MLLVDFLGGDAGGGDVSGFETIDRTDTRKPPNDGAFDGLPPCKNCGDAFSEHMQNGEPLYMCREQMQPMYGFFNGGDPRDFHPDHESCTPEEIERHRQACEDAERLEANRNLPCPSGWVRTPEFTAHILRAPFGIGIYTFPPTCYEATA